jgi:hypothetical protein
VLGILNSYVDILEKVLKNLGNDKWANDSFKERINHIILQIDSETQYFLEKDTLHIHVAMPMSASDVDVANILESIEKLL